MKEKIFNIVLFLATLSFLFFTIFLSLSYKKLVLTRENDIYQLLNTIYKDRTLNAVVDVDIHDTFKGHNQVHFDNGELIIEFGMEDYENVRYNKDELYFLYLVGDIKIEEINYMYNRIEKKELKKLTQDKVDFKLFNLHEFSDSDVDFYNFLNEKYGTYTFVKFYNPIFSSDRKTVIIDISTHCGGTCGGGSTFIYKKINNKWKKVYKLGRWVS